MNFAFAIWFFFFFLKQVLQPSQTSLRLPCSWGLPGTSNPRFITSWIQMLGLQAWTTMPSFVRPGIKPWVSCMQGTYSDNGAETPAPRMSPVHPLSNNCSLVMGLPLMKKRANEAEWWWNACDFIFVGFLIAKESHCQVGHYLCKKEQNMKLNQPDIKAWNFSNYTTGISYSSLHLQFIKTHINNNIGLLLEKWTWCLHRTFYPMF